MQGGRRSVRTRRGGALGGSELARPRAPAVVSNRDRIVEFNGPQIEHDPN